MPSRGDGARRRPHYQTKSATTTETIGARPVNANPPCGAGIGTILPVLLLQQENWRHLHLPVIAPGDAVIQRLPNGCVSGTQDVTEVGP
jgi:hypothetical protein